MKDSAVSYRQKRWEYYANQHAKSKKRIEEYMEKLKTKGASDEFISVIRMSIAREQDSVSKCEAEFPQLIG